MNQFFEDTKQGLLEAVRIKNDEVQLIEKEDMPATTFVVEDKENESVNN